MILPDPIDLKEAFGSALFAEVEFLHHATAVAVTRDDADLKAVQSQFVKGEPRQRHDRLGDVAVAGTGPVYPVSDSGTLHRSAQHII